MSGYWATGKPRSAMPPARTTTIDRTEAKIGRLMKNLENIEIGSQRSEVSCVTIVETRSNPILADGQLPGVSRRECPCRRGLARSWIGSPSGCAIFGGLPDLDGESQGNPFALA